MIDYEVFKYIGL